MARRASLTNVFARAWQRNVKSLARANARSMQSLTRAGSRNAHALVQGAAKAAAAQRKPPPGAGDWIAGLAGGLGGVRRYHLYRPPGTAARGARRPLLVLLHGCGQSGRDFAVSTRMNRIAARHGCLVLYPEQDRIANPQGCWDWYESKSGRTQAELATLIAMIEQVCLLYPVDRARIAVAGFSAGASMAALLATRHPARFAAVAMHSGVPPGAAQSAAGALRAMQGLSLPAALPALAKGAQLPPLLLLQGGRDGVVARRNALATAQLWARATDATATAPRTLQRGKRHPMQLTYYRHGRRVCVTLCEIPALGHAWSGGAAKPAFGDPAGPDASALLWRFVARAFKAVPAA